MRQSVLLFAATAAAFVAPNKANHQITLAEGNDAPTVPGAVQAWWDALPDASSLLSSVDDRIAKSIQRFSLDSLLALVDDNEDEDDGDDEDEKDRPHHPWPPHGGHGRHGRHGHHGDPTKTIYELIKSNNHTTKFAKLVDEFDEIKELLQNTEHNHTLFVPTDRAFRRLPHHRHGDKDHDKDGDDDDEHPPRPPKEFILALLKYHVAPGLYPLHRIQALDTIPTELHTPALSGDSSSNPDALDHHSDHHTPHPQRIRTATAPILHFTRLNFYARLFAGDFAASNGVIHALDSLLVPPPSQTALIRYFPSHFSTLALALETTGLGKELEGAERTGGGTFFAPGNRAWARLGAKVNAFLFSEGGRKYLRALVGYHVVLNETLYSDVYYAGKAEGENGDGEGKEGFGGGDYWHVDLTSLLHGAPISVDVKRWHGFVSIVVNGFTKVVVRDGVADDGVVQVVDRVLIPPHRHRGGKGAEEGAEEEGEISVEELKSRLEPYLEEEEEEEEESRGQVVMGDL